MTFSLYSTPVHIGTYSWDKTPQGYRLKSQSTPPEFIIPNIPCKMPSTRGGISIRDFNAKFNSLSPLNPILGCMKEYYKDHPVKLSVDIISDKSNLIKLSHHEKYQNFIIK